MSDSTSAPPPSTSSSSSSTSSSSSSSSVHLTGATVTDSAATAPATTSVKRALGDDATAATAAAAAATAAAEEQGDAAAAAVSPSSPSSPSSSSSSSSSLAPEKKKRRVKYHQVRAHANPLADGAIDYPLSPVTVDWSEYYPVRAPRGERVAFADVGCGYGGLSVALAERFPDKLVLAMEIRASVTAFVDERIAKLRAASPGRYDNLAVARVNAMKFLPNWFARGQLEKLFFLFPDPHFKRSNYRKRIVAQSLLAEYAHALAVGGRLYVATDVADLFAWMTGHLDTHPMFARLSADEQAADPVTAMTTTTTEESRKVDRNAGAKWSAVYRRRALDEAVAAFDAREHECATTSSEQLKQAHAQAQAKANVEAASEQTTKAAAMN